MIFTISLYEEAGNKKKKLNKRVNSTQPTFQQLFVQIERAEFEAAILKKNDQLHLYCKVVFMPK